MDIDEVEVLLAHELRLEKYKKKTLTDVASLNLTHATSTPTQSALHSSSTPSYLPSSDSAEPAYPSFKGGCGPRGGRGCGGRNSNVQCQFCFKYGHTAATCRHRFNLLFQPPSSHNTTFYGPSSGPSGPLSYGSAPPSGYALYPPFNTWHRPQNASRPPTFLVVPPSALLTNTTPANSGSWFPDFGASFHNYIITWKNNVINIHY